MSSRNKLVFGLATSNNWCCNIGYNQQQQIVGLRKNILPKSTQKNQKTQKTSLKKRSGSNKSESQVKKQISAVQKKQCTPPKSCSCQPQDMRQLQPILPFQNMQIDYMPASIVTCIKYTCEKPIQLQKKINFVYNSKLTPGKCLNLGVNDLESFKQEVKFINVYKDQNLTLNPNTTHRQNSLYFCPPPMDPHKSMKNTQRGSDRIDTWDQSPGLSFDFRYNQTVPVGNNNNTQDKKLVISLSSRKHTVLSVNGESELNQQFTVQDAQPFSFFQYKSVKSSIFIDQRQKINNPQIKSPINL